MLRPVWPELTELLCSLLFGCDEKCTQKFTQKGHKWPRGGGEGVGAGEHRGVLSLSFALSLGCSGVPLCCPFACSVILCLVLQEKESPKSLRCCCCYLSCFPLKIRCRNNLQHAVAHEKAHWTCWTPLQRGTTAVAKWHVFMGFGQMEHLPRAELQLSRQKQLVEREGSRVEKCWEGKRSVGKRLAVLWREGKCWERHRNLLSKGFETEKNVVYHLRHCVIRISEHVSVLCFISMKFN